MTVEDTALDLTPIFKALPFGRIDSTSDHAKRLAAVGAASGTVVWALEQTGGRGRLGRRWSSPRGNLYMSAILRPAVSALRATELGFVTAVAVAEAIERWLPDGASVALKWPNDLLVDGAKLGGILLEAQSNDTGAVEWVVIGIGVNVASYPPNMPYPVTSMVVLGAAPAPIETILRGVSERLEHWLDIWRRDGFSPIRSAWLGRAYGLGRPLENGIFHDLDSDGALLLRSGDQIRRVTSGEIQFQAA